jgi:hypothetical protein
MTSSHLSCGVRRCRQTAPRRAKPEQSQPRTIVRHRYRDLGGIVRDDIDTFDASYDDGVVWMTKRRHAV